MKEMMRYEKAVKEAVPFFQWHKWLERTTN